MPTDNASNARMEKEMTMEWVLLNTKYGTALLRVSEITKVFSAQERPEVIHVACADGSVYVTNDYDLDGFRALVLGLDLGETAPSAEAV